MRSSLKELLPELPGGIYRGTAFAARALEDRWEPIGLSVLDTRIGGGLPVGRCSEFFGSLSGGSTNLAIRLMSEVTASGRSVGWIDPHDVFDPEACSRFGSCLQEVLRVRPRDLAQSLDAAEILLRSGDFPLVVLDLQPRVEVALQWVSTRPWHVGAAAGVRLSRAARQNRATLLLLSGPTPRLEGVPAAVRLECSAPRAIWASGIEDRSFLQGLQSLVKVHRSPGGSGFGVSVFL
ncbi:MAG: hypothetical protein P8K76_14035 [Candidatus Binatia bacterium]|nr:hypothetical protein [Candidatus Binatia bacterium]MDG2010889.1 hypothetical protein [Candidatus Binatia bacterium]